MKKILLIATGGTIACKYTEDGLAPKLTAEELLQCVPLSDIEEEFKVDTCAPFLLDSTNIRAEHWIILTQLIEKNYESYDGFVICHGTDTMAYTAAALSYLIQNNQKPVVITGAQKPINQPISDAGRNLLDSIRFALHPKAHGTVIVFDGKVIAGTRAKKIFSKSYNAFISINYPEIAVIHDRRIIFYIDDKSRAEKAPLFYHDMDEKIFLLKLIPGLRGDVLAGLAEHYDGLIMESFGVGGLPDYGGREFESVLEKWTSAGKLTVMSTQVTHDGSDMCVYKVGKRVKKSFPVLETYDMTLEAAVTKMMWILGLTREFERCRELFYTMVNHDIMNYSSHVCQRPAALCLHKGQTASQQTEGAPFHE